MTPTFGTAVGVLLGLEAATAVVLERAVFLKCVKTEVRVSPNSYYKYYSKCLLGMNESACKTIDVSMKSFENSQLNDTCSHCSGALSPIPS